MKNKILAVDDTEDILYMLTKLLEVDYQVLTAISGMQALEILQEEVPDLILLDVGMPGMNGFDVCIKIKEDARLKEIPVIFITAFIGTQNIIKGFKAGGVDYITKPFNIEELKIRINTHVKLYQYHKLFKERTALELIKNEKKLQQLNEKLEQKVKERTQQLNKEKEQLEENQKLLKIKNTQHVKLNNELRNINNELLTAREHLHKKQSELIERVKELQGLFKLGQLTELTENPEDIYAEFVNNIAPEAMQFPEKALVYLQIYDNIYCNVEDFNLNDIKNYLSAPIKVNKKQIGVLKVTYTQALPFIENYEKKLIEAFAARISITIERNEINKNILQTIIKTEEKERERFAQEIHDGLGPIINSIKLYIQWLTEPNSEERKKIIYDKTIELIKDADQAVRRISFNLSPYLLQNFGLIEALKKFTKKIADSNKITIEIKANDTLTCSHTIETCVYRIITECINNTLKHAKASKIEISIKIANRKLFVIFKDNGIGFNVDQNLITSSGIGLHNIQNRIKALNGTFEINSKPDKGVKIEFVLDVNN